MCITATRDDEWFFNGAGIDFKAYRPVTPDSDFRLHTERSLVEKSISDQLECLYRRGFPYNNQDTNALYLQVVDTRLGTRIAMNLPPYQNAATSAVNDMGSFRSTIDVDNHCWTPPKEL
ncbi:hypothetical protein B0H66DRAFT_600924 [Apodospora peruviana]|uniref:Uncharacterized protein n=1 Tax=Apodospora peruviana TaxID=516989 RepID=A0AAE0MBU2_9PEZI|nr:hypothetical protein B0H66DRAFT_600924 [Apodospora peruviana]